MAITLENWAYIQRHVLQPRPDSNALNDMKKCSELRTYSHCPTVGGLCAVHLPCQENSRTSSGIVARIETGRNTALVKSCTTKIRLITRRAFGFQNVATFIFCVRLTRSGKRRVLPTSMAGAPSILAPASKSPWVHATSSCHRHQGSRNIHPGALGRDQDLSPSTSASFGVFSQVHL